MLYSMAIEATASRLLSANLRLKRSTLALGKMVDNLHRLSELQSMPVQVLRAAAHDW